MRVWVYPEKVHEELGARRFVVEWEELRPECKARDTGQENDEFDYDRDLHYLIKPFKQREDAERYARKIVDEGKTFFGCARVQEQVVDWYVEEDRVASWENVGEEVEVA
jgi:hypothetical protein